MMKIIQLSGLCLLIAACSFVEADRDVEIAQPMTSDIYSSWDVHYLGIYGMDLEIKLPPEVAEHTEISWNESFGRIEVSAPKHKVDFFITGEIESVASRRFDLDAGIFKIEYLDEGEDHLFYKAALPDGSLPYFHFFKSIKINDKTYQFQNNPLVEFERAHVELMLEIAGSASPPNLSYN